MNALKTLIFTILVPGTLAVVIPYRLAASPAARGTIPLGGMRYFGLVFFAAGALIYLWCAWDFAFAGKGTPAPIDPPKELVVRGLYKHIRNPMYVGLAALTAALAFFMNSWWVILLLAPVLVLVRLFVIAPEERYLRRRFGADYEAYMDRVRRWV